MAVGLTLVALLLLSTTIQAYLAFHSASPYGMNLSSSKKSRPIPDRLVNILSRFRFGRHHIVEMEKEREKETLKKVGQMPNSFLFSKQLLR